jgi:serine/threonine-protein kinase HipA
VPKRTLHCWWGDARVAELTARRPWELHARYTDEALDRWATNTPLLSCSLPVQRRAQNATPFLRGLLPEGSHLQALAHLAGLATNDLYGLLARYGCDVAGALVITTSDDPPEPGGWSVEPYTDESLAAEIMGLDNDALGVHADSALSIAGLQNKILLVELDGGRWGRPVRGHPSTHILKVDDAGHPGLIGVEAQCLRLAERVGLSQLAPIVTSIAGYPCLIVRRYDRELIGGSIQRIHQEDVCQALGIDPQAARDRAKYESSGGPSYRRIASLLVAHARDEEAELTALTRAMTFTFLIGNADAHGKNLSLLHDGVGHISLAPLYDTVPTALWPNLRATSAMSVNSIVAFDRITLDDLATEASSWGLEYERALTVAGDLAAEVGNLVPAIIDHHELATRVLGHANRVLEDSPRRGP